MGIASLLNSSINIISSISSLGIETSGVKHISSNYIEDDIASVSKHIRIIKKISLYTGLFGTLLAILSSSWLSKLTFGNTDYTFSFIFLSITLLFKQLSAGELVILQGLRKYKFLAKTNFYGNLVGLLVAIPLYYYYKINAIVPVIILASVSSMLVTFYYTYKLKISYIEIKKTDLINEGKSIIKLGLALTLTSLLSLISSYIIQIYLSKIGSIEIVGFYNAGFTLLNTYVGIVFVAMSKDYFPKLSAISNNNFKVNNAVNEQSLLGILIITPIIIVFLSFSDFFIKLLFSKDFIIITLMVKIGIVGMLFRVVSFSLGYVILAKADTKLFIKTAIGFNFLYLLLNFLGYYFYGLLGIGIAFVVHYFLHFLILTIISYKRYNFSFDNEFNKIYFFCMLLCFTTYILYIIENDIVKLICSIVLILVSSIYSLKIINRKVDLISLIKKLKK